MQRSFAYDSKISMCRLELTCIPCKWLSTVGSSKNPRYELLLERATPTVAQPLNTSCAELHAVWCRQRMEQTTFTLQLFSFPLKAEIIVCFIEQSRTWSYGQHTHHVPSSRAFRSTVFFFLRHSSRHLVIYARVRALSSDAPSAAAQQSLSNANIRRTPSPLIFNIYIYKKASPPFSPSHHRQLLAFRLVLFYVPVIIIIIYYWVTLRHSMHISINSSAWPAVCKRVSCVWSCVVFFWNV